MAHFAELNEDNIVLRVIVVADSDCVDDNGAESEEVGATFCSNILGGRWLQTSYNANFRKNYAGKGYVYDAQRDAFIEPQPGENYVLDEETCRWQRLTDEG